MSRTLAVALQEWKEHTRQPWMIGTMSSLLGLIILVVLGSMLMLNQFASDPMGAAMMKSYLKLVGFEMDVYALAAALVEVFNFLCFTQLLSMTAVLAGHSVIHDRQCHTLPFLLLAPLRRGELLAGKVLGAVMMPFVLYVVLAGTASVIMSMLPVTAPMEDRLPFSGGWVVAFFIGAPIWALFVATICALMSSMARDVRTSQQAAWFFVFFASFVCGFPLASLMSVGALFQLIIAGMGGAAFMASVVLGSAIMSRDLGR